MVYQNVVNHVNTTDISLSSEATRTVKQYSLSCALFDQKKKSAKGCLNLEGSVFSNSFLSSLWVGTLHKCLTDLFGNLFGIYLIYFFGNSQKHTSFFLSFSFLFLHFTIS